MKKDNRGKWENPLKKAIREQEQADQILRSVQAAEHYNYLKKKFGPRPSTDDPTNKPT